MACRTFLAPYPTRYRLISLPNFATTVASFLLAELSVVATIYHKFDETTAPNKQTQTTYLLCYGCGEAPYVVIIQGDESETWSSCWTYCGLGP
jgi:hypothetical protein